MTNERTVKFLMANLGSEVSRFLFQREKGDKELASGALKRAEKIIAELKSRPDIGGGAGELDILKNVLHDFSSGQKVYSVSPESLEDYFLPFALAVMK